MSKAVISLTHIESKIYLIRRQKVMIDHDLAAMYEVETKFINRAVNRNSERFPVDFMFQLNEKEYESLRFQFGTSNQGRGGRRYLPYVFTQEGIAMLSSVLHSPRAIQVNITIMRAFVKLRELMLTHKDLARKIEELEKKYDSQFQVVFEAIRQLMSSPIEPAKKRIGFHSE